MFSFPGDEKNQPYTGADGTIGNIEGGKTDFTAAALLQIKIKKIHDRVAARQQAIGQITGDAAKNQAEGDLAGQRVRIEVMPREEQRDEGEEHDDDEGAVVAAENVPRCAGVTPVNELEKTVNDDFLVTRSEGAQHQPFGELVECEDDQRDKGDATVRDLKNGFGRGHDKLQLLI